MFLGSHSLFAQFYSGSYNEFGKNRVQYDDQRVWRYYRFQQFDTYFYEEGKALAIYASSYAYKQIKELEAKLDYTLSSKVKIIVFKDLSDLKETNIGLITDVNYNIGGVSHIIDNKLFIYFDGDHENFNLQIRRGLSKMLFEQMVKGSSIGSSMKNSYLMEFPTWYSDGLISFISEEWSSQIDLKVRDGILSGKYKRVDRLSNEDQIVVGHSLWRYLAKIHGQETVSEILYMAKINRNIETGFLFVLGKTYDEIIEDWYAYYEMEYNLGMGYEFDSYSPSFLKKNKQKRIYKNLQLSSNGQFAVFTQNEIGKTKVILKDLISGKSKTIKKYGTKLNEKVDYSYPILAWSPLANYLALVYEEKGKNVIEFYDAEAGKWRKKRYLMQLDKVLSMQYNQKGNKLIFSAIIKGQSDIFLYFVGANSFKRITNDIYDDHFPAFVNNDEGIIFSSNRKSDTIRFDIATNKHFSQDTIIGMPQRDLFYYNMQSFSPILRRVTQTEFADETHPYGLQNNQFTWISDETGITNRYLGNFDSTISYVDTTTHYKYYTKYYAISDYKNHIQEQTINTKNGKICEIVQIGGHHKMFIKDLSTSSRKIDIPYITQYKEQSNAAIIKARTKPIITEDTSKVEVDVKVKKEPNTNKRFRVIQIGSTDNQEEADSRTNSTSKTSPTKEKTKKKVKVDPNYNPFKASNYTVEYEINELVSQVDFNYMNYSYQPYTYNSGPIYMNKGFAAFMKVGAMDVLEDKRITGGVNISPNLRNNEYFATYSDLTKRLDKEYTFHRVLYETNNPYPNFRQYVHEGFYKLSWPFSTVFSLRTTFNIRNERTVVLSEDRITMEAEDQVMNKVGAKAELIWDSSRKLGLNLYSGTRWKIFAEYFQPIEDFKHNTFIAGFDYRKYIKIHKNLIWANRAAGSVSLGTDRLIYYLGGVDNWMIPKFNEGIQVDERQTYVYQTLATNMRGFKQNIRNGSNFIAINSELRWPIFNFFSKKPVKNNFLNNFLIVGFFDVGSAWSGWDPFSDDNSLYRYSVTQQPVTVTIINQNEPLVAGYGLGTRFSLFGYYIRMDWAWGIQNGYIGDRKFYLSLDLDF